MSIFDAPDDLPLGETAEIAPGVRATRRGFFATVAAALGGLSLPGLARAETPVRAPGDAISYEEFLKEVIPPCKALVGDTSLRGQSRYLYVLASHAIRLADVTPPEFREGQGAGPGTTAIGANPGGDPFTVLHWKMGPGAVIKPHPHIYGNVVTLGLEGEARVENYEMVDERDFARKGTFRVRKTVDQLLTPGTTNLVNLERSYVHGFRAGAAGARGLDLTTRIRPRVESPQLLLEKRALDAGAGVYEASWVYA